MGLLVADSVLSEALFERGILSQDRAQVWESAIPDELDHVDGQAGDADSYEGDDRNVRPD